MESATGKTLTFSSVGTAVGKTGKALPAGEGLAEPWSWGDACRSMREEEVVHGKVRAHGFCHHWLVLTEFW